MRQEKDKSLHSCQKHGATVTHEQLCMRCHDELMVQAAMVPDLLKCLKKFRSTLWMTQVLMTDAKDRALTRNICEQSDTLIKKAEAIL